MPDRPWHRLRALVGGSVPEVLVCVDTEAWESPADRITGARQLTFRLGVATATYLKGGEPQGSESILFSETERFWSFLERVALHRGVTWVFAHNLGFDFTLLGGWHVLDNDPSAIRELVLDDPPSIISYLRGRRLFRWVDTLNYWRAPLAALGASIGLCKLEMPNPAAPTCDWADYCRRDVDIIKELIWTLINFTTKTLCCSFGSTAAGLAWRAYRASRGCPSIFIHGNYRALSVERAALFGGRLECFASGAVAEPVTAMDVTSLYPHVMSTELLPRRLVSLVRVPSLSDVHAWLGDFMGVAAVTLGPGHPPYPRRIAGKVEYREDAGDYTLADPELRTALASGTVRSVNSISLYEGGQLFGGFLRPLLRLKERARTEGRLTDELICKLVINSLSGKWAQRNTRWIHDTKITAPDRWGFWWSIDGATGAVRRCRAIAGVCSYADRWEEPDNSFPVITSCIASYGRCALERYCRMAGTSTVLYTDTDSIHVRSDGADRLRLAGVVDPTTVGKLRIIAHGKDAYYWSPKNYRIGDYRVCGCVAATATEVADGVYQQDSFAGIRSTIQSGNLNSIAVGRRTITLTQPSIRATRLLEA